MILLKKGEGRKTKVKSDTAARRRQAGRAVADCVSVYVKHSSVKVMCQSLCMTILSESSPSETERTWELV